jgi:hypothetical protein
MTGLLGCCVFLSGCLVADGPSNKPSQEQLRIQSATTQEFTVTVADRISYPVPADGRVTIDIPCLGRGCTRYLLGVKVRDFSSDDLPAIRIRKHDRTVQKLSLNQFHKLPLDHEGCHLLKIE